MNLRGLPDRSQIVANRAVLALRDHAAPGRSTTTSGRPCRRCLLVAPSAQGSFPRVRAVLALGRYGVARAAHRRRPPVGPCASDQDARRADGQRLLPGRSARAHADAGVRGDPASRARRGADPDAGHSDHRLPARGPAADRAGAARRPRDGRHRARDAAGVPDGLRRAGPQRGDVPAGGLHGLAPGVPGRPRGVRARPDAGHRRLAGALLRPAHRARCHVDHRALRPRRAGRHRAAGEERAATAGLHRQRRRGPQREGVHRPRAGRRRRPPVRRGLTMRFGVLGTGHWATEVHAAALGAHPSAELVGIWGRDLAKAKAVGAELDVPGFGNVDELLSQVDAVAIALPPHVQAPLAERAAAAGKHLLLEKPIALDVAAADRVVAAVREAGVASVVFLTFRFQAATSTWLTQAARTQLAGGAGSWLSALAGTPFAAAPWRQEHGALWDIGPHALSVLVPALGPVIAVQAGAGVRDIVHLVLTHESGVASTVTLSHTVAPLSAGVEFFVHGDAGRLVLLPESGTAVESFTVAVDDLLASAMTGGSHPCDVAFGRDVVAVLAT